MRFCTLKSVQVADCPGTGPAASQEDLNTKQLSVYFKPWQPDVVLSFVQLDRSRLDNRIITSEIELSRRGLGLVNRPCTLTNNHSAAILGIEVTLAELHEEPAPHPRGQRLPRADKKSWIGGAQ